MSWKRFFRRKRWDEERALELTAHLQIEADANVSRGMLPDEARYAANRKLGNVTQIREEIFHMNSMAFLETIWNDMRLGMRILLKNPGFTIVAVLTLTLGIAANTAIFSVVNNTLLRPLPYENSNEIFMVWGAANAGRNAPFSQPNFLDYKDRNRTFEHMAAFNAGELTLTGASDPEQIRAGAVTADFFKVLKVDAALGRTFSSEEDQAGHDSVVVLSHGIWQRRFGEDPNIVGKTVSLNQAPYTVIGVLPADFDFSVPGYFRPVQAWTPAVMKRDPAQRGNNYLRVIGRLKPGVTLPQAQADVNTISDQLAREYAQANAGIRVRLILLREQLVGNVRPILLILLGVVGFGLLIACANVANLQLARASARQKEIAIRATLGATRGRLIRQLLTESVLLGLVGGLLGVCAAWLGHGILSRLEPASLTPANDNRIGAAVFAYSLGLSVLAGILFGFAPALQSSVMKLGEALKSGGRSSGAGAQAFRFRNLLTVAEIALAVILLIGAGLLLRSFARLLALDPGFATQNVLTQTVDLPNYSYPNDQKREAFYQRALERIAALPGVEVVGAIDDLPLTSDSDATAFSVEGRPEVTVNRLPVAQTRSVTADYFRAMGIPLVAGRALSNVDTSTAPPVVLINQSLARRIFPSENPIGKRVKFGVASSTAAPWTAVAGVVADVRDMGLDSDPPMEMYQPYQQAAQPYMNFVVRTVGYPNGLSTAVQSELRNLDKDLPLPSAQTMEAVLADSIAERRFNMILLGLFAGVALLLAAAGVYGVISYSVLRRTQEIGVRMALGALPRDVFKLILGQGLRLALLGAAIGVMGALLAGRVLAGFLFGVSPNDPTTYGAVFIILVGVALLACYVPARRAAKVHPTVALRYE